jgi:glycosyltransferase involved in cell wall biosynthesis
MRLLQVCTDYSLGGIERHVLELTDSLRAMGHTVFLSGSPGVWMDVEKDAGFFPLDLENVAENGSGKFLRIWHAFKAALQLRRFIRKTPIDLIHTHETAPLIVATLATLGSNIPVLVTYHGSSPQRLTSFARLSQWAARLVITPSKLLANDLSSRGKVSQSKLKVIPYGVRKPPIYAQDRIDGLRARLLGSEGKLLVIIVARLVFQKGIDVLVDVVKSVKAQRPDIRFVLVGHGELEKEVKAWISEAGIGVQMRFDGVTDDPFLYMYAGDLFLLTSRWEAQPIVIAEAFQAGLPVVATDVGGVSEVVSTSVGRLSGSGDVPAIAKNILEICNDDQLRKGMSEKASELSQAECFSLSHMHKVVEQTYADILGLNHKSKSGSVANSELGKTHTGLHPVPGKRITIK